MTVSVTAALADGPQPPLEKRESVLLGRAIAVSEPEMLRTGRLLLPQEVPAAQLRLWTWDGTDWSTEPFTVDGSYAVFAMDGGEQLLFLTRVRPFPWVYIGGAAAAALTVSLWVASSAKKKKQAQTPSA